MTRKREIARIPVLVRFEPDELAAVDRARNGEDRHATIKRLLRSALLDEPIVA